MSWDYEEIKQRKKSLNKKSPFYKDDLEMINEMLKLFKKETIFDRLIPSFRFSEDPLTIIDHNLSQYCSVAKFTNPILLRAFALIKNYGILDSQRTLKLNKISVQECMEMMHEFAKSLPEPFNKEVEKYTHESFFQFSSYIIGEHAGLTCIIRSPSYKPYYLIANTGNIETFISMVHEIGHGIFMKKDTNLSKLHKLFGEVEGFFFEYLALKFLKNQKYFTEKEVLIYDNFDSFSSNIYQYFVQALHLHLVFQAKRFVSTEEILTESLKYQLPTPLSESYIELNLTADFFENTKRTLSYLISLELQNIKDLEKALHYLYKLRTNHTVDVSQLLEKYSNSFLENNFVSLKRVKERHNK